MRDPSQYEWTTVPCEALNQDGCLRVGRDSHGRVTALGTTSDAAIIECTPAEFAGFVAAAKSGQYD